MLKSGDGDLSCLSQQCVTACLPAAGPGPTEMEVLGQEGNLSGDKAVGMSGSCHVTTLDGTDHFLCAVMGYSGLGL